MLQYWQPSLYQSQRSVVLQDVRGVLDAEFPGQLDVVYEGVGGDLFRAALANLSPAGRLLSVGYISVCPPAAPRSSSLRKSQLSACFRAGLSASCSDASDRHCQGATL